MKLIKKYKFGNSVESSPIILASPLQIIDTLLLKDFDNLSEQDEIALGVEYKPIKDVLLYASSDTNYRNQEGKLLLNIDPNLKVAVLNGQLFTRSMWDLMRGAASKNRMPSEDIDEHYSDFEVQLRQNHADLQARNPQGIAWATGLAIPTALAGYYAWPVINTGLKIAAAANTAYQTGLAINDIAEGDYKGAAIHGGIAASSALPFGLGNLSKYPRIASSFGLGFGGSALYAEDAKHDTQKALNVLNSKEITDLLSDSEFKTIVLYLKDMGYSVNESTQKSTSGNIIAKYHISSPDVNYEESTEDPWYYDPNNRFWAYLGAKYGVGYGGRWLYKKATNKDISYLFNPKWLRKIREKYPKAGTIGANLAGDAAFFALNQWLGDGRSESEQLSNLDKDNIIKAITLLYNTNSEVSLSNLRGNLILKHEFYGDTTDYIPKLQDIDLESYQSSQNSSNTIEETDLDLINGQPETIE